MARKKLRMPSPSPSPPPATPPREESTSDEEAEAEATPATQKAPQIPKPQSSDAADADSSDGGEEEESSDSETDANAFKLRQVAPSTGKPSESGAADEEDGTSSESPEPIQKKPKAEAAAGKKRQLAESTPSGGKAKKAKADVEKPAAPLSGKAPSEPNASSKGGKKQREKAVPPSKPAAVRRWTIEDEIKVLDALVSHVKANGTQPSAAQLIAAVGVSLERKNCSYTEMYEKVRNLKQRHEKAATTGTLPGNEDDLRKFNLSEAVWGETAKEVAALTMSQNDAAASSKSNKGQINKEKAKEADTPVKSKKRGNHKEELENDAKAADITKETTNTATQNGGTSARSKSGKPDKEKKNGDAESLGPKEATPVTQNDETLFKNGETHEDKMDTDPNMGKGLDELHNLYPNLASYVESIQAQHPCGETLKRAFVFIADDKACAFEAKIKKQRVAEMKMDIRRADTKKEVANLLIGLLD